MLSRIATKLIKRYIWILVIITFSIINFFVGRYNSVENNKSIQALEESKDSFEEGNVIKAKESFSKMDRKGVVDYYPEYKSFYSLMEKVIKLDDEKQIEILGIQDDKFIENKAYLIINNIPDTNIYQRPFIKVKGWAPKINTLYPLNIKLEFNDNTYSTKTVYQDGFFELDIPIANIKNIQNGQIVKISTDRYYSPKMLGLGDDPRNLSVQLNEANIYDYNNEQKELVVKGKYEDNWMGKNIDIDINNFKRNIKGVKLDADIPKQLKTPFNIVVRSNSQIIQVLKVDKNGERELEIILPDELLKKDVVQLNVTSDNTYCPKDLGINGDARDMSLNIKSINPIYLN